MTEERNPDVEMIKTVPFLSASFAEKINARRRSRKICGYDSYVVARRHHLMDWVWAMPVDDSGIILPNESAVIGSDGFVLMVECFRRIMLQWNDFPKISMDGGKTYQHFSRLKDKTLNVIRSLLESSAENRLQDRVAWAVKKTNELCRMEEFVPRSEEYYRFWWMFFISLNGDEGYVIPSELLG